MDPRFGRILSTAIYVEAARWGDYRYKVHPHTTKGEEYTVDSHYMAERNRLLNTYFPNRSEFVLRSITNMLDESPTNIDHIDNVNHISSDKTFNLDGSLNENPGNGIYIRNKKKIIIKSK